MMEEKNGQANEAGIEVNTESETTNPEQAEVNISAADHEKLSAELQEQKDKYLRLFAEFDNFKRRTARERIELSQTAGKDIIQSLLEVVDDFERAEKQMQTSDDIAQVKEGTLLIFNKLKNVLQQKGLTEMQSINTDFDVEKHEAVTEIEAGPEKKGKVVDELVKGYYMNDKIIRFAKVVVGK